MATPAIQVHSLGKSYRLGDEVSLPLLDLFKPWKTKTSSSDFWALKDVSFAIQPGESVGIIGRNGAGKSTLLKILSRITAPTVGTVRIRGRLGTLLEVGTGFHPDLSGRDNIYMSGTLLGLSYSEVKAHLDQIVDFAGVGKFIDTPVKRYSSGMQVKLAFAVALYLDPEILIVDEVLAVGDLEFQKKSIRRLREVTEQQGRTVLFVSHSLDAVRRSCQRAIVLDKGGIAFDGRAEDGIEFYRDSLPFESTSISGAARNDRRARTSQAVTFTGVQAYTEDGARSWKFYRGDTVRLDLEYEVKEDVQSLYMIVRILTPESESKSEPLANLWIRVSDSALSAGQRGCVEVVLPGIPLRAESYPLYIVASNRDDTISYDALDANVSLPNLTIRSRDTSKQEMIGMIDIPYRSAVRSLAPFHA